MSNKYYEGVKLKNTDNLQAALCIFQVVLKLENGAKGEWGFKALVQIIEIYFNLPDHKMMTEQYKQLLKYTKRAVKRTYSEEVIEKILDYISKSNDKRKKLKFLLKIHMEKFSSLNILTFIFDFNPNYRWD